MKGFFRLAAVVLLKLVMMQTAHKDRENYLTAIAYAPRPSLCHAAQLRKETLL